MCGIHGILALRDGALPAPAVLSGMGGVTAHRGPDDEGVYRDARILLGMRRLSILDLSGGHQPIANEDESLQVVCNGEIYNYRELTAELEAAGHRFRTRSDTEVLLHLYEEHGDDFVRRLNGMYGFALWDSRRGRLLIGRDRLGIKPVYWLNDGARLLFASEAKAILSVPGVTAEIDPVALQEYLALGYVPGPLSIFRGIRKLPAGCLLICEGGRTEIRRFWEMPSAAAPAPSAEDWGREFLETMEKAVV